MDRGFVLRAELTRIGDCVEMELLDKLKFIVIPEAGIKEKIKTFEDFLIKLRERYPNGYINALIYSFKMRDRNDIAQQLEKLQSNRIPYGIQESMQVDGATNFINPGINGRLIEDNNITNKANLNLCSTDSAFDMITSSEFLPGNYIQTEKSTELRNYQMELAQDGINGKNCIICAPTGSGKTMIAGYICKMLIEMNPKMKIIFLVHVRSLAKQQAETLSGVLGKPVLNNPDTFADQYLKNYNVIVLTHQILINELKMNAIELQDIHLIIFDECHHTKLDHPYNQLMNLYHRKKKYDERCKLPQIIGLTASLGTDNSSSDDEILQHFANLCARLDCNIKIVEDESNRNELLRNNPKPSTDQIISCSPRINSAFHSILTILMTRIEDVYKISTSFIKGSQEYQQKIIDMRKRYETLEENIDEILACRVLESINDSLVFYNDATEMAAVNFLWHCQELLKGNENSRNLMGMISKAIEEVANVCFDEEAWKSNEKLVTLCRLLEKMSEQNGTCIVIVRTCRIAKFLYDFLSDSHLKEKLYCFLMVGQKNDEFGMTESQQQQTLSMFKRASGERCSVLIATDIIQEGMDYPKCNSVIRYNFVGNEIATVQSRGRARAPDSQIFLIADEGSVNIQNEYKNLIKERKMLEVLESMPKKVVEFEDMLRKAKDLLIRSIDIEIRNESISKTISQSDVSFHCITCKMMICHGSSVRRHPAGFISLDADIETRTKFTEYPEVKDFKFDERLGTVECNKCDNKLFGKMRFKFRHDHQHGYILKRDNLLWKRYYDKKYNQIPKWKQLPFSIEEFSISQSLDQINLPQLP